MTCKGVGWKRNILVVCSRAVKKKTNILLRENRSSHKENLRTKWQPFLLHVLFSEHPQVLCVQNIMNNLITSFLNFLLRPLYPFWWNDVNALNDTPLCFACASSDCSSPWHRRPKRPQKPQTTIEEQTGNSRRSTSRCSKSTTTSSSISLAPGFPIRPPPVPQLVQSHESTVNLVFYQQSGSPKLRCLLACLPGQNQITHNNT